MGHPNPNPSVPFVEQLYLTSTSSPPEAFHGNFSTACSACVAMHCHALGLVAECMRCRV